MKRSTRDFYRRMTMPFVLWIGAAGAVAANCPPPLKPMNAVTAVDGATFQRGISSNSLFSIFGSEFASPGIARPVGPDDLVNGKFPTEFACIVVEFDGERVPIIFVSPVQINAQAPTRPLSGPVRVTVIRNPGQPDEVRSSIDAVQTQPYSPGFFTFDSRNIAAQHLNYDLLANPSYFDGTPAKPGEIVILYGNGFGYTDPVWQAGELTNKISWLTDPITVTIAGITLAPQDIYYAGLAYGSISGLYQFNVRVPEATPNGMAPVVIRIGGFQTQAEAGIPVER
jgi:uncharacterized protein (TIGR03437 family)